jgi:FAD-dependent urate hydroxylase
VLPGGAKWLRPRIEGQVQITEKTRFVKAIPQGQGIRLELDDGTTREVDYMMLGTGYRPGVQKLSYIDASLLQRIQQNNGYPVLDKSYEASVPGMYFGTLLASWLVTPLARPAASYQARRH